MWKMRLRELFQKVKDEGTRENGNSTRPNRNNVVGGERARKELLFALGSCFAASYVASATKREPNLMLCYVKASVDSRFMLCCNSCKRFSFIIRVDKL
jgi:hypothetical protein